MSAPPYMKLYVADYLADTVELTTLEHGAYLLLLMAMWRAGGRLPSDDARLTKISKCTAKEWAQIKPVVLALFQRRGGILTHKRVAAEIAKYETVSERRKEAGRAGGSKTASKNKAHGPAFAQANDQQLPTKPEPEPEPESQVVLFPERGEKTEPQQRRVASPTRGSRLKPDWEPSGDNIAYAVKEGFVVGEVQRMAEAFRDYWTAATGQKATKLDWSATWRRWVRTEADRRRGNRQTGPPKRVGFV